MGCPVFREPASAAAAPLDPCAHNRSLIRRRIRSLPRTSSSTSTSTNSSSSSRARAERGPHRSIERYLAARRQERERERERLARQPTTEQSGTASWESARLETQRLRQRIQRMYAGGPTPGDIAQSYRDAYLGSESVSQPGPVGGSGVSVGRGGMPAVEGWGALSAHAAVTARAGGQPRDILRANLRIEDEPLARQLRLQIQQLRNMEASAPRSLRDYLGPDSTRESRDRHRDDQDDEEESYTVTIADDEVDADSPWPSSSTTAANPPSTRSSIPDRLDATRIRNRFHRDQMRLMQLTAQAEVLARPLSSFFPPGEQPEGLEQLEAGRNRRMRESLAGSLGPAESGSMRSRWSDLFESWNYPCEFEREEDEEEMEEGEDAWEISVGAP